MALGALQGTLLRARETSRGGSMALQEKRSEPSPGRGRGGFLRILRIRGLEDSDLQVVPPNVSTRLEA